MKASDMKQIATFMKRVIFDHKDPSAVGQEVEGFRRSFKKVKYCFESQTGAYEYFDIK